MMACSNESKINHNIVVLLGGIVLLVVIIGASIATLQCIPIIGAVLLSLIWTMSLLIKEISTDSSQIVTIGVLSTSTLTICAGILFVLYEALADMSESINSVFDPVEVIIDIIGISRSANEGGLLTGVILLAILLTYAQTVYNISRIYWKFVDYVADHFF